MTWLALGVIVLIMFSLWAAQHSQDREINALRSNVKFLLEEHEKEQGD